MTIWRGSMAARGWGSDAVIPGLRQVAHPGMTKFVLRPTYTLSSACLSILPVPVFGNSSMKRTSRGYL
jgi:hypothetical protein